MGKDIDRQTHPDEPGKRSRLWHAEDVSEVLMDGMGTEEIDAIVVDDMHNQDAIDMTKAFRSMRNLTLLQIHSHDKSRLLHGSSYLPKDLRWVTWENYSLPSLPIRFKGDKLVGLELPGSSITKPWHGVKYLPKLCLLDLSYSRNLIETPDFTGTPNLKEIKFAYCTRLVKVHESIGSLGRLVLLSFRSCKKLKTLPQSFQKLKSLRHLDFSGCVNLKLPKLRDYQLEFRSDNQMLKVPSTIGILRNLVELDISHCRNLSFLPVPSLKLPRSFPLHDTLVDIVSEFRVSQKLDVQRSILDSLTDHSLLSESETSQELIECKKE